MRRALSAALVLAASCVIAADDVGIGADCAGEECPNQLECASNEAGRYCVKQGCSSDDECPNDSVCMVHGEHGDCVRSCDVEYCIRTCILYHERPEECSDDCPSFEECNVHRGSDSPAFCISASHSFDGSEKKICVPLKPELSGL